MRAVSWVSNLLRESQRERKESSLTFCAQRTLGKVRTVPWASNLLTEFQQERKERLFSLVPPHVPVGVQFGYDLNDAFRKKNENKQPEKLFEVGGCQMRRGVDRAKTASITFEVQLSQTHEAM